MQYDLTESSLEAPPEQTTGTVWTRLTEFRFGDIEFCHDGKLWICGKPRICHGYVENNTAKYSYDRYTKTLTVDSYTTKFPSATFVYRDKSWWVKTHDTSQPTPFALDQVEKFGGQVKWSKSCVGPTRTVRHEIGVVGGSSYIETRQVSATQFHDIGPVRLTCMGDVIVGQDEFHYRRSIVDTAFSGCRVRRKPRTLSLFSTERQLVLEYVDRDTGRNRFFIYTDGLWYELAVSFPNRLERGLLKSWHIARVASKATLTLSIVGAAVCGTFYTASRLLALWQG